MNFIDCRIKIAVPISCRKLFKTGRAQWLKRTHLITLYDEKLHLYGVSINKIWDSLPFVPIPLSFHASGCAILSLIPQVCNKIYGNDE